jgi:PAN domain
MGPLEFDKAYLQGDLYSRPATSAADCSVLCLNDKECKAMTYIKSQQLCWIKGEVRGSAVTSDMISATKQAIK